MQFVPSRLPSGEEIRTENDPPAQIDRSSWFLCRDCLMLRLCFAFEDRFLAQTARPRINCERINAPFADDSRLIVPRERLLSPDVSSTPESCHHLEDAIPRWTRGKSISGKHRDYSDRLASRRVVARSSREFVPREKM